MGGDGQGEKHPNHRDRKSDGELMSSLSEGTSLLACHHLAVPLYLLHHSAVMKVLNILTSFTWSCWRLKMGRRWITVIHETKL